MIKTDLEWTKYILGKLDKKTEMVDGNPTCVGLQRIFEQEFGKIISKGVRPIKSPSADDKHATLIAFIHYFEYPVEINEDGEKVYAPEKLEISPESVPYSVEAGVDTSMELLPEPFNAHIVASLDTRALSRALKQAMFLNCLTDDEVKVNDAHRNKISPVTVESILNRAKKMNLDVDKFLTISASCTSAELTNLSAEAGYELIETIKSYEEDPTNIPAEMK